MEKIGNAMHFCDRNKIIIHVAPIGSNKLRMASNQNDCKSISLRCINVYSYEYSRAFDAIHKIREWIIAEIAFCFSKCAKPMYTMQKFMSHFNICLKLSAKVLSHRCASCENKNIHNAFVWKINKCVIQFLIRCYRMCVSYIKCIHNYDWGISCELNYFSNSIVLWNQSTSEFLTRLQKESNEFTKSNFFRKSTEQTVWNKMNLTLFGAIALMAFVSDSNGQFGAGFSGGGGSPMGFGGPGGFAAMFAPPKATAAQMAGQEASKNAMDMALNSALSKVNVTELPPELQVNECIRNLQ